MELTHQQDRVALHVAQEIGSVDGIVELKGSARPLALLHVAATEYKPFQVLVTAGVSEHAMPIPTEMKDTEGAPARVELLLGLPPDWPVQSPASEHSWPVRLLAELARFASDGSGWLMEGHTVPNGDPMEPYDASTQLSCALIAPPLSLPPKVQTLSDGTVLLAVVPLFRSEVELKLEEGVDELLSRLDVHEVSEVLFPGRRAVAGTLLDLLDKKPNPGDRLA